MVDPLGCSSNVTRYVRCVIIIIALRTTTGRCCAVGTKVHPHVGPHEPVCTSRVFLNFFISSNPLYSGSGHRRLTRGDRPESTSRTSSTEKNKTCNAKQ